MIIFESLAPANINQLNDELIAQIPAIRPTEEWQPLTVQGNDYIVQILANVELPEAVVEEIQTVAAQHQPQIKHAPQWDTFYQSHRLLLLYLISQSPMQSVSMALIGLFSRRRDPNFGQEIGDLIDYWNVAITPVLDETSITTLQQGITEYHLPLILSTEGRLTEA